MVDCHSVQFGKGNCCFFLFFYLFFSILFFIVAPLIHTTLVRSLEPVGYLENVITQAR